jgi:hypothetical protein
MTTVTTPTRTPVSTRELSTRGADAPPTTRPFDPETMIRCADYHAHQGHHRRLGKGWTCVICNPQPGGVID